jgi:hypothetical protein
MLRGIFKALIGTGVVLVGASAFVIVYFAFFLHQLGPNDALLINYDGVIYPVLPLQLVLAGLSTMLLAGAFLLWLFGEPEQPHPAGEWILGPKGYEYHSLKQNKNN